MVEWLRRQLHGLVHAGRELAEYRAKFGLSHRLFGGAKPTPLSLVNNPRQLFIYDFGKRTGLCSSRV